MRVTTSELALFGPRVTIDLSPLCAPKRTYD
jgi:hypothetical protein